MPQIFAYAGLGLLLAAGLGIFLYNLTLARQGWRDMKTADAQVADARAESAEMEAMVARSNQLRQALKDQFGKDYTLMIEPIDMLAAHAISALTEGDQKSAMDLMDDACHEMEAMLRQTSV